MKKQISKFDNNGFTLIEIVLAVLILGIVFSTLFFSYSALFQAREKIERKTQILSQAETALLRIVEDLNNFYCELSPLYKKSDDYDFESKYFFIAENEFKEKSSTKLNFTSYSHLSFGINNLKSPSEIFYFLEDNILYRGDFYYPYPKTEDEKKKLSFPICTNVEKFNLYFYDEEKNEYEFWDSDSLEFKYSTPYFVKLELELYFDDEKENFETKIKLPVFREKEE
ncbi:MAG: prepilin-type N-terminal cleavage/methylation domain-containing protein [Desulforegulaceae bacterium]|nr:prepilin-type N-terminal cleavage/methylation domain-containing protein [Desulforegulaceae bacterium]